MQITKLNYDNSVLNELKLKDLLRRLIGIKLSPESKAVNNAHDKIIDEIYLYVNLNNFTGISSIVGMITSTPPLEEEDQIGSALENTY